MDNNEMDGKEIRDRLLGGSVNLDRLEKDVKSVIGMVRKAILLQYPSASRNLNATFESPACRWQIWSPHNKGLHIECEVRIGEGQSTKTGFSTFVTDLDISTTIQTVFEGLPVLLEGVRKQFPSVDRQWKHIIAASYAYEKLSE